MMTVAEVKRDDHGNLLPLQSYDETIRRGMSFLLDDHVKWFKGPTETLLDEKGQTQMPWVYYSNLQHNGAPFPKSVDRFVSYPAFHHALLIRTFIGYSRYTGDKRSLAEAVKLADWDIAHSTPADWPYGNLPWSTYEAQKPGGFRDKSGLMPDKAAIMGLAYLQLHEATGEARFLKAAEAIAKTLAALQRPDGTWPFRVDPKTEKVIEEYTSSVIYAVRLFETLDKLNGNDRYRANRDKTWNWLVNGPIKTKEFRGFYEDIPASKDGRTNYDCLDTIRYLLANRTATNGYLEMAKELNAWVEKTFMDKIKGFEPAEGIREQLQCNVVMGIHSLNWASMLMELSNATGDEMLRQRALQTANYITYYLQPDNRIVVGFQYNQWWYSCHAGVILYLLDFEKGNSKSDSKSDIAKYNVVWDSPSKDCHGSMPLGNGDIGLNAWIEPSGELVFYIGKTDSWEDNARLAKVGRVRVKLDPAPVMTPFRQELSLADATLVARYGDGTRLRLWVDANHPIIHVVIEGGPVVTTATASLELWRTNSYVLPEIEQTDVTAGTNRRITVEPDTVLTGLKGRIGWYHHNIKSEGPAEHARIQGMSDFPRRDPLLHRTFGALISCDNPVRLDDTRLQSGSAVGHRFDICVLTRHPATPAEWLQSVEEQMTSAARIQLDERRQAHERWWRDFWNRSWIQANTAVPAAGTPAGKPEQDDAAYLSQMCTLQRFITACAGRGAYPIKFNGSIFTVAAAGKPGDADYRAWGPAYWWQNTRLPCFSMCANGDYEMLEPLFRMYVDELLPLHKYRTKKYFGFDNAAYYPEVIMFWGDVAQLAYGWTPMEQRKDPLQTGPWHKYAWVGGLELICIMLEAYEHTGDEALLQKRIIPTADAVIRFFDCYYKTNAQRQLVINPSQALETYYGCTNAMPEVAGLHAVTVKLLALPECAASADQRAYWKAFAGRLPPLPTTSTPDGEALAAAAAITGGRHNFENPELYAVFPFRLCAFEKENRTLGVNAVNHRADRGAFGWRQDDLFMAYLGLTNQVREYVVNRARNSDKGSRFPAFWGPNYDWIPDQDHGGVLVKAVQSMLLQSDGEKIFVLPAWPRDWDVSFKLHATGKTVVECELRAGKIVKLEVTPESRKKDVVIVMSSAEESGKSFFLRAGDRVMLLGNSITAQAAPEVEFIKKDLVQHHSGLGTGDGAVAFSNVGTGGWQAWQGLEKLKDYLAANKPTVCVIGYGTCEVTFQNQKSYVPAMKALVKQLREAGVAMTIVAPPPPSPGNWKQSFPVAQFVQGLPEMGKLARQVAEEEKIPFVDTQAAFAPLVKARQEFTTDGIHLNSAGYRVMADALLECWGRERPGR